MKPDLVKQPCHAAESARYRLTIRALPDDVPPEKRLARLLKTVLRVLHFRCEQLEPLPAVAPKTHADGEAEEVVQPPTS